MTTGKDIAARRQALDMTQDILARAAGVSRSTVQRAERGLPVSAESLRSIRAVLELQADPPRLPVPYSAEDPPLSRTSRPGTQWAWYADPCLLLPSLTLAAMPALMPVLFWIGVNLAGPGLAEGSLQYNFVMLMLAVALPSISLCGRILWRKATSPSADRVILGMGRRTRRRRAWMGGTVEFRAIPLPVIRWSRGGRPIRTWPGAAIALALVPAAILAMHADTLTGTVTKIYASVEYRRTHDVVPAWRIEPGSPLDRAGLRLGDLVLSIDGKPTEAYFELWTSVADGMHGSMDVEVLRSAKNRAAPGLTDAQRLHLAVRPVVENGRNSIGDLQGLLSPTHRDRRLQEILRIFGRELTTIAGMAVSPARSAFTVQENGNGHLRDWLTWLVFWTAAEPGVRILTALMALAVLTSSLAPTARGMVARLPTRLWRARAGAPRTRSTGPAASPVDGWTGPLLA